MSLLNCCTWLGALCCRSVLVLSLLPVLALTGVEAQATECPLAVGEYRIKNKAMPGTGIPQVSVVGVMEASPEKVWRIIDDCNGYRRSMPRVIRSKELSRSGGKVICQTEVEMPFPFSNLHSEAESISVIGPGDWSRTFRQTRGDYAKSEGSWHLTPCGAANEHTRVDYVVHAIVRTAVPDALVRSGMKSAMGDLYKKINQLAKR
jgi:hypothetical protein